MPWVKVSPQLTMTLMPCFYNPAGITQFDKTEVAIAHSTWFVGLQHDFIGAVYHLDGQNSVGHFYHLSSV